MKLSSFRPVRHCELPIFRQDHPHWALFYAPGYLAVVAADQANTFEDHLGRPVPDTWAAVHRLHGHAGAAQQDWMAARSHLYVPVCLTLYLNNECNLACSYCYVNPSPHSAKRLDLAAIRAGASLVATHCRAQYRPLTVVLHGGGEPTLDQEKVDRVLDAVEAIATAQQLAVFRYVATNGVMSVAKAVWLARRFDLLGLSCDGPEPIQTRQRPQLNGAATSVWVERTARLAHEAGTPLHVRVTITPQSLQQQTAIAEYVCRQIRPQEIHVEPVYRIGQAGVQVWDDITQADLFVTEFLKARTVAQSYGVGWYTSGSRLGELHGPYCNVFRDVLNLVPGGIVTACFKTTTAAEAHQAAVLIGKVDPAQELVNLDYDRIRTLSRALHAFAPRCQDCFNRYHCVRGCPDYCPLEGATAFPEFRCRVQQGLVNARLQERALQLLAEATGVADVVSGEVE